MKRRKQPQAPQTIPMSPVVLYTALDQFNEMYSRFMDGEELRFGAYKAMPDNTVVGEGSALHRVFGAVSKMDVAEEMKVRGSILALLMEPFKAFDDTDNPVMVMNRFGVQEIKMMRQAKLAKEHIDETRALFSARFHPVSRVNGEEDWDEQMKNARQFVRNVLYSSTRFYYPNGFESKPEEEKAAYVVVEGFSRKLQQSLLEIYDGLSSPSMTDTLDDKRAFRH